MKTETALKIQIYLDNIRLFLKAKESKHRAEAIEAMIVEIEKLLDIKY